MSSDVSAAMQLPFFWDTTVHHKVIGFRSFLVIPRPANRPIMEVVGSFETSRSAYSVTHLHTPEERNPHKYESLNGKTEGKRQLGISQDWMGVKYKVVQI